MRKRLEFKSLVPSTQTPSKHVIKYTRHNVHNDLNYNKNYQTWKLHYLKHLDNLYEIFFNIFKDDLDYNKAHFDQFCIFIYNNSFFIVNILSGKHSGIENA